MLETQYFDELLMFKNRNSGRNKKLNMKFIETLITPILKAVGAVASDGMGIFKKRKKSAFDPKISLGFNF
jgi:hypothetical protein